MIKIDVRHLTPRPAFAFNSGQCGINVQETHKGNEQLPRNCQNHTDSHFNQMERENESSRINQALCAQSYGREMDEIHAKADQSDQQARCFDKSTKAQPPEHLARIFGTFDGQQNNRSGAFTFGEQQDSGANVRNENVPAKPTLAASHDNERSTPHKKIHGSFAPSLNPLAPRDYEEAQRLAKLLCDAKMAPQGFEKPETCLVGILQGMEMGLSPLFALQRMAIVDGRLTIWGDGALALVLRSGLCVSITEWLEGDDESEWISHCEVLREGWDRPITRSFAVQDAKRANLWHKPGPWTEYPKRMLQMRARAFALRDVFADVLGGLYFREEIEPKAPQAKPRDTRSQPTVLPCYAEQQSSRTQHNIKVPTKSGVQPVRLPDDNGFEPTEPNANATSADDIAITSQTYGIAKYPAEQSWARSGQAQAIEIERGANIMEKSKTQSEPMGFNSRHSPELKAPAPPNLKYSVLSGPAVEPANQIQSKIAEGKDDQPSKIGQSQQRSQSKAQSVTIINDFESDLGCCHTIKALEQVRLNHQPHLDLLGANDLDRAGNLYLQHEARIEAEQPEIEDMPPIAIKRKRRIETPIRKWRVDQTRMRRGITTASTVKTDKNSIDDEPEQHDE
jgi:hypothetical protein